MQKITIDDLKKLSVVELRTLVVNISMDYLGNTYKFKGGSYARYSSNFYYLYKITMKERNKLYHEEQ